MGLAKLPTATDQDSFTTWNWLKKLSSWITGTYSSKTSQSASFTPGNEYYYPINAGSADIVVTMPAAKNSLGKSYLFQKTDSSTHKVTITAASGDLIGAAGTAILNYQYASIGLIADAEAGIWRIVKETAFRGDFSDASAQQQFMQTTTVDDSTVLTLYPNGTGITSIVRLVGSSDVTLANSQFFDFRLDGGVGIQLLSRKTGSAVALPMQWAVGGVNALKLDAANATAVNIVPGAAAALATNATDGFMYQMTCAGTPTGTPTAYTGTVPVVVDTTNNKLYYYNASWKQVGGSFTSPLTTKGDILGYSTVDARIPVGTDGYALCADSSTALGVAYKVLPVAGGGTGTSTGGMVQIAQVVTSGTATTITFSSIPQNYTNLRLILVGRDTKSSVTEQNFYMKINSDTTSANYISHYVEGSGVTVSAANVAGSSAGWVSVFPGTSGNAQAVCMLDMLIASYSGTVFYKIITTTHNSMSGATPVHSNFVTQLVWKSTAAITDLSFTAPGTAFVNGTTATLYGMP